MEPRNLGVVRGGNNVSARFHLRIKSNLTPEEAEAIFSRWDEEFTIQGELTRFSEAGTIYGYWNYHANTRREFAILPAVIRKALACGYRVSSSQWDVGLQGETELSEDFWQVLALAQAFFRE